MSSVGQGDAALGEDRDRLRVLFDDSPIAVCFARGDVVVAANPAYARLFGYDRAQEVLGKPLLEQIAPSHRAEAADLLASQAPPGKKRPQQRATRGLHKNGTAFSLEVATRPLVIGDPGLLAAFFFDVSEHEQTAAALRASEERFRMLSAAAFEGVFVHADGKILLANETGAAMYGFDPESIVGASVLDLAAPESREIVAKHINGISAEPYEGTARRRDGSTFLAEVRGRTLLLEESPARVTVVRDITERRRIEGEQAALGERVRHTQKLETLGVLAGGVAHDFNSILTVISNAASLARLDPALGSQTAAHLDAIALATERAADLCRQMLVYAGKAQVDREELDLSALVGEMWSIVEASIAKRATLLRELAPGLPPLFGDATQLRQIIMNLVLNASEAIAVTQGTIRVSTGAGTYAAAAFERSAAGEAPAGEYVWLEVADDGVGMDRATLAQMFDPFFTTKIAGRGLGMAAVLGMVRGHRGAIDVESSPGRGTRVRVFFPAGTAAQSRAAAPRGAPERPLVLLVDDEANVRMATALLLREAGFEVVPAGDGVEALDVFLAQQARIDVVLVDRTMPRMNGIALIRELRRIAPQAPVVLSTGYSPTEAVSPSDLPDAVLPKPYTEERLLATLRQAIAQKR